MELVDMDKSKVRVPPESTFARCSTTVLAERGYQLSAQPHRILMDQDARMKLKKRMLKERSRKPLMRGKPCEPSVQQQRYRKDDGGCLDRWSKEET